MFIPRNNIDNSDRFRHYSIWVVAIAFTALAACATVATQGFRNTNSPHIKVSYVATDADFGKYRRLTARETGIFFPESSDLSAEEIQRIRQIFRNAFLTELQGYEIVDRPGPDTMMVQASIIDLRNASINDVPSLRSKLRSAAQPGALVFLMELRDSETDRVLARAADNTDNPKIMTGVGAGTDWDNVETAARHWATLFRQFLDENFNR